RIPPPPLDTHRPGDRRIRPPWRVGKRRPMARFKSRLDPQRHLQRALKRLPVESTERERFCLIDDNAVDAMRATATLGASRDARTTANLGGKRRRCRSRHALMPIAAAWPAPSNVEKIADGEDYRCTLTALGAETLRVS